MRLTQGLFRFPLAGLLCLSTAAFAESQLSVRVTPANAALKANIEAYVGSLGERDEAALQRSAAMPRHRRKRRPRRSATSRRRSTAR